MARLWKAAWLVFLGFALIFLVAADSPPNTNAFITAEQANARTVLALTQGNPPIVGWALRSETLVLGLTQVHDATGKVRFDTYPADNAYVLYYTAPAQHGCTYIYAIAETSADPGGAGGGGWQVSCTNDPQGAYPGPGSNSTQPIPFPST
jgi:hypothetical protein